MSTQEASGQFGLRLKRWVVGGSGWLVAILLGCYVLSRAYHKLRVRIPAVQQAQWRETMRQKTTQIQALQWGDPRPLFVFAGDSHMEMGRWYELLQGRLAIANIGLSQARIEDVTELVAALPPPSPHTLVLMCGINNLGRGESVQACLEKYEQLLRQARSQVGPKQIVVLSVMPVRSSPVDAQSRTINGHVAAFNEGLSRLCVRTQARFLPMSGVMNNGEGALKVEYTFDGLHLNQLGYEVLAAEVYRCMNSQPERLLP